MKICIDDGSTNIKLAWTHCRPAWRKTIKKMNNCSCQTRCGQVWHPALFPQRLLS
ncbi:plasmid segregation protein ParM domain-containing protein [Escherichia coli]|uniref:plasmid segregation protein ParM domain-containing protein n=1 Tax=Escherichia coli TaxID=562 RepID=UPI000E2148FF|nr:hypothetical protein [Escherichia coli]EFW7479446.1 hypothetical protein [Shigella sonnei]EAB0912485.1 hypothetical protein [Escherichia coli]EEY5264321.1 hypothetical protein [Escherichia coli]EEY5510188.1 hypothetical protein [Escherichia coli]